MRFFYHFMFSILLLFILFIIISDLKCIFVKYERSFYFHEVLSDNREQNNKYIYKYFTISSSSHLQGLPQITHLNLSSPTFFEYSNQGCSNN